MYKVGQRIKVQLNSGVQPAIVVKLNPSRIQVQLEDGNIIAVRQKQIVQ